MQTLRSIDRHQAMLLIIDVQTRLLPHIEEHPLVTATAGALLETAQGFDLPVLATVQYTRGLGPTVEPLARLLAERHSAPIEKVAFSVWREQACRERLLGLGRSQVIVAGIEAHVCVQQSVLDLLGAGYQPVVCADAVSSRRSFDRVHALERMRAAGAVVTTAEAVMFELCEVSGTPAFKRMLEVVKRLDAARAAATQDAGDVGG